MANELAREYCRRGSYFYSKCLAAGDPLAYIYEQADVDQYQECDEWKRFVEEHEGIKKVKKMIDEVRGLRPQFL